MSNKNRKNWYKRSWIRLIILFVVFAMTMPMALNIVILNAVTGIWIWIEIIVGIIGGILWLVNKLFGRKRRQQSNE